MRKTSVHFLLLRPVLAGLLVSALSGCITLPQTPDEFRQMHQAGSGWGLRTETHSTSRRFQDVYRTLENRVPKCLDVTLNSPWYHRNASRRTYVAKVRRISASKAEVTIQLPGGVGVKQPEDGAYILLVDIVSARTGGTALTLYGRETDTEFFESFERWAIGKDLSCPDLSL